MKRDIPVLNSCQTNFVGVPESHVTIGNEKKNGATCKVLLFGTFTYVFV